MRLAGYYRRFIEGFSKIVAPLTHLTRKDQPFAWTDKCEESFQELKKRLTSPLCWYQDGEAVLVGPELLQQTTEKVKLIQERMKASQSRQKSYADQRRRPLEFSTGDHVFLKVTPTTGVGRTIRSRKLSPKYIGPYQILNRVGPVAYEIAMPP